MDNAVPSVLLRRRLVGPITAIAEGVRHGVEDMPQKRFRKDKAVYDLANETQKKNMQVMRCVNEPMRMVPRYQIPEISVVSIFITYPVPGFRSADSPHFVPPKLLADVSPFHNLSHVLARKHVVAPQTQATYVDHILASQVVQPPGQMGLGTVVLENNSDSAFVSRDNFVREGKDAW